jgi:hypothetical protein
LREEGIQQLFTSQLTPNKTLEEKSGVGARSKALQAEIRD